MNREETRAAEAAENAGADNTPYLPKETTPAEGDAAEGTIAEGTVVEGTVVEGEVRGAEPAVDTLADKLRSAAVITMCASAALLIIGMTMWLVPWATIGWAAGFITVGGVFIMASGALSYRAANAKLKAKKGISARKDVRAKNARNSAYAVVGRVALIASFFASVALIANGLIGTNAYICTMLVTLGLFAIWAISELYYINKH